MQESTSTERARSALVLVLPSLLPRRTEERDELVCGRVRLLPGRENNPVAAVSVWSLGGEGKGWRRGRVWQRSPPFNVEDIVCFEPHLEVDQEELKTVPMQENGQT